MENVNETVEKKSSSKKTLLIILSVIAVIVLLFIAVAIFVVRAFFSYTSEVVDTVKDMQEDTPVVTEYENESEFPLVSDDLEDTSLITSDFPEDIPLSGGKVISSSSDEWNVKVEISTNSSLDDTFDWYVEQLEKEGWRISSRSKQDNYAQIAFEKDERKGNVTIVWYEWGYGTTVEIKEMVWL